MRYTISKSAEPARGALAPSVRDARLDVLRGLAILVIAITHMEQGELRLHLLRPWLVAPFGVSTWAELFVGISGMLYGLVYGRAYVRRGPAHLLTKSLRRAGQIYVANLLAFLGALLAVHAAYKIGGDRGYLLEQVKPYLIGPNWSAYLDMVLLRRGPDQFDILPLYVILLLLAPGVLMLLLRRPEAGLAASAGVALAGWCTYFIPVGEGRMVRDLLPWSMHYFDPLGWQLLFSVGMYFGVRRLYGQPSMPRHAWLLGVALVIVLSTFAVIQVPKLQREIHDPIRLRADAGILDPEEPSAYALPTEPREAASLLASKHLMGPGRLVHFMALIYVLAYFLAGRQWLWRNAAARVLAVVGKHSLYVFAFGLVLNYLGHTALQGAELGTAAALAFQVLAVGLAIGFAYALEASRRRAAATSSSGSGSS